MRRSISLASRTPSGLSCTPYLPDAVPVLMTGDLTTTAKVGRAKHRSGAVRRKAAREVAVSANEASCIQAASVRLKNPCSWATSLK
jgi:hypothetical protein